jgi:hypothetical protein
MTKALKLLLADLPAKLFDFLQAAGDIGSLYFGSDPSIDRPAYAISSPRSFEIGMTTRPLIPPGPGKNRAPNVLAVFSFNPRCRTY